MCRHTQEMDAPVCSYSYHCEFLYWMLYWFQDKQGHFLGRMKLNCAERNTQLLRARLFNFRGSQGISVWVMNGGKEEYREYIVSVKGRSSSIWASCQETKLRTPNSSLLGTRGDVFFSAWSNSPVSYIDQYWVTCQLFNQSL